VASGLDGAEKINAETQSIAGQDLRDMQKTVQQEGDAKRSIAGREAVSPSGTLQPDMREHEEELNEARILMEGSEAPERIVRSMRIQEASTGSPHRSGQDEQHAGQRPDAMQALPRLLAHNSESNREENSRQDAFVGWWQVEPNVGRVTDITKNRAARLKALGNGQVPLQAALAWRILGGP
jgi:hypothetical protein